MPSGAPSVPATADRAAGRPWLSVVVPVLDEEQNLPELHRRLRAVLDHMTEPSEIIFVNDGSTDRSIELLEEIGKSDPHVTLVDLAYNSGQHAAVLAGFRVSRGEVVVTLDADLQNPPEEIPKLLDKIRDGFEVVGGVRQRRNDALGRKALSVLVRAFSSGATDYGCMLRAYRRHIIETVVECDEKAAFVPALANTFAALQAGVLRQCLQTRQHVLEPPVHFQHMLIDLDLPFHARSSLLHLSPGRHLACWLWCPPQFKSGSRAARHAGV